MLFDTGNVSSTLTKRFFQNNKETVEQNGILDSLHIGGYGGIDTIPTYRLAGQNFKIWENSFSLRNIHILTHEQLGNYANCDGVFGVNFIRLFDKVTLNLDKMRIEVLGNINNEALLNKEFNIDFKLSKKYLVRTIHYDKFDVAKMEWEPTAKFQFTESFQKMVNQADITKKASHK